MAVALPHSDARRTGRPNAGADNASRRHADHHPWGHTNKDPAPDEYTDTDAHHDADTVRNPNHHPHGDTDADCGSMRGRL